MAKDDYFVLAYKILSYLYTKMKEGENIDPEIIKADSAYIRVNERYWAEVMAMLQDQGYIRGLTITKAWGDVKIIQNLEDCKITPDGIAYLHDNSTIQKAKEFLKDIKATVPFI